MSSLDAIDLAQLLTLAALVAASCEYAGVMRRREQQCRADRDRLASEAAGLRGLVRVFLGEASTLHHA